MIRNIFTKTVLELKKITHRSFTWRLVPIFEQMDFKYDVISAKYNFGYDCFSCNRNCCETLFYHHTLIEYLYVIEGFLLLSKKQQRELKIKVLHSLNRMEDTSKTRNMCPLNYNDRCIIYAHRPMICRLHGVPYRLTYPNGKTINGPGCQKFVTRTKKKNTERLDRTQFYLQLAALDSETRKANNFKSKLKLTISEMLLIT